VIKLVRGCEGSPGEHEQRALGNAGRRRQPRHLRLGIGDIAVEPRRIRARHQPAPQPELGAGREIARDAQRLGCVLLLRGQSARLEQTGGDICRKRHARREIVERGGALVEIGPVPDRIEPAEQVDLPAWREGELIGLRPALTGDRAGRERGIARQLLGTLGGGAGGEVAGRQGGGASLSPERARFANTGMGKPCVGRAGQRGLDQVRQLCVA